MSLASVQRELNVHILDGMARTLWVMAWASYADELKEASRRGADPGDLDRLAALEQMGWIAGSGEDWDEVSPDTPKAAMKAAGDLDKLIAESEGIAKEEFPLVMLFAQAVEADTGEPLEYDLDDPDLEDLARDFGSGLAHMAMGDGVSWFDDHKHKTGNAEFDPDIPSIAVNFDGEELTWEGAHQGVIPSRGGQKMHPGLVYANALDYGVWGPGRGRVGGPTGRTFVFRFGGFTEASATYVVVYALGFEDALDQFIDWVAEVRPDSLANARVQEAIQESLKGRDLDELSDKERDEIIRDAEVDTTQGGNSGDYIYSEDWSIVAEDPSNDELDEISKTARQRNPCSGKGRKARRRAS